MSAARKPTGDPATGSSEPHDSRRAIELLRIGVGLVWVVNLLFIVNPENQYWSTFSRTALAYAPTKLGGPGLAQYVAAHPLFFAWAIALLTGYLAVALLLGLTTRLACFVGSFFSALLLATQFGSTFLFPGGTDVGAHPLYILVYAVLIVGGAGTSLSADQRIAHWWADRRRDRSAVTAPVPNPWATAISPRVLFTYFVAGTLVSLAVGFGLVFALPIAANAGTSPPPGPPHFVNPTVAVDPQNGWPQFSPANFTVPHGRVYFTIVDHDMPMNWTGCPCPVRGTANGVEAINGTPVSIVAGTNVAHTFNIPVLGRQVLSPGQSVVQFVVDILGGGRYVWYCFAPCGTGADPYNSPPMGVPGYMTGTMTVT
jgi:hypothetical protein